MSYLATLSNMSAHTLWGSTLDKEYLRLQVLADAEASFERSTDEVLNMNTYTCHICDFEVPKQYSEEHNNGANHKNLLKIADLALERTRKQIKSDKKVSRIIIQVAETYFCEQCAVVVQTGNKLLHEISDNHLKLLKYSKIVRDFLMVYEDKDALDLINKEIKAPDEMESLIPDINEINCANMANESNEYQTGVDLDSNEIKLNNSEKSDVESKAEAELESKVQSTYEITSSKVQNADLKSIDGRLTQLLAGFQTSLGEKDEEDENTESKNKKRKRKRNVKENTKTRQLETNESVKLNNVLKVDETQLTELSDYLKIITDKCKTVPIHSLEAFSDKIVIITTINSDQIKVPVNNFHSTHGQKNKMICKICLNPNIDNSYRHQISEEHMEKVMIPIEDKNAIRKIDDIWSHCILCNDLTKNLSFHLQSLMHVKKLKQCLVVSDTDVNENVIAPKNQTVEASQKSQSIQEHGLIASHNDLDLTCNICDDTIPNEAASISQHVKTFKHITNYNTTIENNKMNELDDAQYYCIPCDMCVVKRFALGHCNGKKHNKHLTDIEKAKDESTRVTIHRQKSSEQTDIICFVCNIVLSSVDKHSNSLEHKKNYLSYLEANKLNEIEQDTFYCIPCNTVILVDYLMTHCTSKKHKTHLKNLIGNAGKLKGVDKTSQVIRENTHISRSITQSVQNAQASMKTKNPPKVLDKTSKVIGENTHTSVSITQSVQNAQASTQSKNPAQGVDKTSKVIVKNTHTSESITQSIQNAQVSTKSKNPPKVVDKTSKVIGENTHTSGSITRSVQNAQASTSSQNPPPVSQSDTAIPIKFLYQFRETSNARSLLCTICHEKVPYRKHDLQRHVSSIDHVVAFDLLMLWNKVKIMDDKYFCDVCKVYVTYFNELSHISGAKHVDAMTKPESTAYEYDKVLLTLKYAMSHKTGDRVRPSLISVKGLKKTEQ